MKFRSVHSCLVWFVALACGVASGGALAAPPVGLTEGVKTIAAPGTPGTLAVWSENAAILAVGQIDGVPVPVAAAGTTAGETPGRIVAFSHTGHLDPSSLTVGEHGKLLENAAKWAAGMSNDAPRVALLNCKLGGFFKGLGFEVVDVGDDWAGSPLKGRIDLLCIVGNALDDTQVAALAAYLNAGGGLLAAQTAWAWKMPPAGTLRDNPLNKIAAGAGIAWTGSYSGKNKSDTFDVGAAADAMTNAASALAALARDEGPALDAAAARTASHNAMAAARLVPAGDTLLRPRLEELRAAHMAELIPTEDKPLDLSRPLHRVLLAFHHAELTGADPVVARAHAQVDGFPNFGAKSMMRRRRTIEINTGRPGWHSTGMYAPPGLTMRVDLPESARNLNLRVRIGCHTDELWHLDTWKRVPSISFERTVNEEKNPFLTPYGGMVYVVVPEDCEPRNVSVIVHGCYDAPYFELGQTKLEEWTGTLRNNPAPWAELATDKVVISVPSSAIRTLDDPQALMNMWDRILDAAADLAAMPRQRTRPERYVADVQISAGYMHAGYPIMTHLDAVEDMVDASRLAKGSWGLFHELGHNHQSPDWTFDGTVEVTCNLFSLYICETVCGMAPSTGHPALENRDETIGRYLARGAKFDEWKREPFTALIMYMQLREAFGWEAYKKVFAEYRELPDAQRPKTDDDKRDQWMVRFSRAVGKNLGPFFSAWGVPTSQSARDSIANLPEWMPEGFPPKP